MDYIEKELGTRWKLYFRKQINKTVDAESLEKSGMESIEANVPGNVELDLSAAGLLPEDLYKGMNITLAEKYEDFEWWYETEFECDTDKDHTLLFEGVDCIAAYFLNGIKIGESDNMLIPHSFDTGAAIKKHNKLVVHIFSSKLFCANSENDLYNLINNDDLNLELLSVRKAPHMSGWDIMPRAMSAGIWKDVYLCTREEKEITDVFCGVKELDAKRAVIKAVVDIRGDFPTGTEIEISGKCAQSEFCTRKKINYHYMYLMFDIEKPVLWWPYGYGDANIYDCTVKAVYDGKTLVSRDFRFGVRTAQLVRTDTTQCEKPRFEFLINGVRVMCKGTNWVPMDAYHSRDKQRYAHAFELMREIGCNIVRCWGGNVYEQDEFYDFCDENGIMIWQDFSMACGAYPQNSVFCEKIRKEAEYVVRKRRMHPSILLWSGDNECDEIVVRSGTDPNGNVLTRNIIKEVVRLNDYGRAYLPSSPYISPAVAEGRGLAPEQHVWGPRDYFKSSFYCNTNAKFISEAGYHGCPQRSSIEKFIDAEYVWPIENNVQWTLHSSDQRNDERRVMLMKNQIIQLFGECPDNLDDFILCSQISQAEAVKFFIEHIRCGKAENGGIIWWNLIDGWPQFSDAVVDYYYEKKLAFDYIKRAQQPFAVMIDEPQDWNIKVIASNDTQIAVRGIYSVSDIETGQVLSEGEINTAANENETLGTIPFMYSDKRMLLIRWEANGEKGFNHYLCGMPGFDFNKYKRWLNILQNLKG